MARNRGDRQHAIRDIVRNGEVRTQHTIVDELRHRGFTCTQATVSRDISDMGLRKLPEGGYVLREDLRLHEVLADLVEEIQQADNQVVVRAQDGKAMTVSLAIDAAEMPEVVGTLAGSNTVLVITGSDAASAHLAAFLTRLQRG